MFTGITGALKGINGEYELTRVVGGASAFAYIIGANAFTAWHIASGNQFDLTAYCLAFPGGTGAILASIAGAASVKDRNIAVAKATEARTRTEAAIGGADAGKRAADKAAEQVADAAEEEKDKIKGDRTL